MIKKQLIYLLVTSALLLAIILATTLPMLIAPQNTALLFDPGDVSNVSILKRGSTVDHGEWYTLNYTQQTDLLNYLNDAKIQPTSENDKKAANLIRKLMVYRLTHPAEAVQIQGNEQGEWLFKIVSSDQQHLTQSQGALSKLLANICE